MLANGCNKKWCAFCKFWYDPTNSALTPANGNNMYDVDIKAMKKCNRRNAIMKASSSCCYFQSKMNN